MGAQALVIIIGPEALNIDVWLAPRVCVGKSLVPLVY